MQTLFNTGEELARGLTAAVHSVGQAWEASQLDSLIEDIVSEAKAAVLEMSDPLPDDGLHKMLTELYARSLVAYDEAAGVSDDSTSVVSVRRRVLTERLDELLPTVQAGSATTLSAIIETRSIETQASDALISAREKFDASIAAVFKQLPLNSSELEKALSLAETAACDSVEKAYSGGVEALREHTQTAAWPSDVMNWAQLSQYMQDVKLDCISRNTTLVGESLNKTLTHLVNRAKARMVGAIEASAEQSCAEIDELALSLLSKDDADAFRAAFKQQLKSFTEQLHHGVSTPWD